MPELPEVETTLRGIKPHIEQQIIINVVIRQPVLRWKIPAHLKKTLLNQKIIDVSRRGKYLLLKTSIGTIILHLGMSGSLRILEHPLPAGKHDHVDLIFKNGKILRLNDPRRFGALLWCKDDPHTHTLLSKLGPEPLSPDFSADYLAKCAMRRSIPIKTFIMNSQIVVGVGNIYANEALFAAKIHPKRAANQVSLKEYQALVKQIKKILQAAIKKGGTTLRNFTTSDGKPGYFKQQLNVYGRKGEPCYSCKTPLKEIRLNQRSTVYCAACQK